ncbi:MAG: hypothetical protein D6768_05230 [Chloroflexi bacterium]|nr:MAG: hypothetical protein D6768_05230 [Chloroflexota bacterium]
MFWCVPIYMQSLHKPSQQIKDFWGVFFVVIPASVILIFLMTPKPHSTHQPEDGKMTTSNRPVVNSRPARQAQPANVAHLTYRAKI